MDVNQPRVLREHKDINALMAMRFKSLNIVGYFRPRRAWTKDPLRFVNDEYGTVRRPLVPCFHAFAFGYFFMFNL
ncbi:hypothetical protein A7P89_10875 [Eikenella corrodens]|uniref:Uncharacterized protein n=1 Tax=Eikenella corrodens TaxID=539 RepID=A0A1A9RL14_EIKCO|nr:hypothetical protein A7P89_10875 [Eikenella corrodens]